MKRKYKAQAFLAGSSCATCNRRCARDSRRKLSVLLYCYLYRRDARYCARAKEGRHE